MSRLNRLIYREDIAGQIAEQDRRLDTTITSFQVSCSHKTNTTIHNGFT